VSGVLDLRPILPAAVVAVTALVVLLVQAFTAKGRPAPSAALSVAGLAAALVSVWMLATGGARGAVLAGAVTADDFSLFLHALILSVAAIALLLSPSYLKANGIERGEHYALVLFSVVGMLGLVSSLELVSMFVALEIMSIALYALTGMQRVRAQSQEAALKYFITGAFSSAFFLYGVALLYGASGSTELTRVAQQIALLSPESSGLAILGTALLFVGFAFKVGSVPFHMWAPDVYEGAPTPTTAFMAAGVKAAAFGALLRVFGYALPGLAGHWRPLVALVAAATMIVGNLAALAQPNLKRMLAYSSVAHAGYLLTAMVAAPGLAGEAMLFYLVAYAAVNLGAFGVIAALSRDGREPVAIADLTGLAQRRPALAAALAVFLVSLTGIPVTAGFVGKFYLFNAAVAAGWVPLAIVGVVMSVVSAYYYLGVVVAMYMRDPVGEDAWAEVSPASGFALAFSAGIALVLGVWPAPLLALARVAAHSLLSSF
jgi:NADH-quinone oxidoreductase subunit N